MEKTLMSIHSHDRSFYYSTVLIFYFERDASYGYVFNRSLKMIE